MYRGGVTPCILPRMIIPHLEGLGISHCACQGRVPRFPLPRGFGGGAPSITPSQGVDLGTVSFSYHPFRGGGPSILAALFSTSCLWEEWLKGVSFLLPVSVEKERVVCMCCPSLSKGCVQERPSVPMHVSRPQCTMSLGWICMEEGCSPASHPISSGVAFFQRWYFCRFLCATFWFLPSRVAVCLEVRRYILSLV